MSAIYLAARYGRRQEVGGYASALRERGHVVTSRWLSNAHHQANAAAQARGPTTDEQRRWAEEDWADLSAAGILIAFTEGDAGAQGVGRGGRHVEMGLALAWGKRTVVCGPCENAFYALAVVERYATWADLLASVDGEMQWARAREEE